MRSQLHIIAHFAVPALIAWGWVRWKQPAKSWRTYWLVMSATILVDLDHLLATPLYDPNRCSIGFHPLHSYWAIAGYVLLVFPEKSRWVALGLLIHMGLDAIDCCMM